MLSLEEARRRARQILAGTGAQSKALAHEAEAPVAPRERGPLTLSFEAAELVPYIEWRQFYRAWGLEGRQQGAGSEAQGDGESAQHQALLRDALSLLERASARGLLSVICRFGIFPAARRGDDILIFEEEAGSKGGLRAILPCLRRQEVREGELPLSLADFLHDEAEGVPDWIGAFAVNAGQGLSASLEALGLSGDEYGRLLAATLADRLAEAGAELLFRKVRQEFWGFGADGVEGIRPAPGYPSCPDHRDKALIFELLDAQSQLGLALTESYLMVPASAV
jgi:5-methyltetrahydrofolate--homocysteine methyltransferase